MDGRSIDQPLRKASALDLKARHKEAQRKAKRQKAVPTRSRGVTSYTRFVRAMKYLLPVIALSVILLIVVWPHLQPAEDRIIIGYSSVELSDAADPSMINARYVGTDDENQPFSITADIARQLAVDNQLVQLEMPKADVTLKDGTWLVLMADSGLFERAQSHLSLDGAVNMFHDSGYEIHTATAEIDLALGEAQGDMPVRGHGPFGTIEGQGFRLLDKGKTIVFSGQSKATLFLDRVETQ